MHRNNSYGGHYPHGQQFSGGESPFRSPRPLYQSSPRHYGNSSPQHNWSGPNSSPRGHGSFGNSPRSGAPYCTPYSSDSRKGQRGRGGYSPAYGTPRSGQRDGDSNPGHATDITQYYNPSMIEDPWKHLQPVPVKNQPADSSLSKESKYNRLKSLSKID